MTSHQAQRPEHWQLSCSICLKDHPIRSCKKFLNYTPTERYELITAKNYCFNCLARSHKSPQCKSTIGCHTGQKGHNTLLHGALQLKEFSKQPTKDHQQSKRISRANPQQHQPTIFNWNVVFIPTASVKVIGDDQNTWISTRAIINRSLIISRNSKTFVSKYKIKTTTKYGHGFAVFKIKSHSNKNKWSTKIRALITKHLPRKPYSGPISADPTEDFPTDSLADIDPRLNNLAEIELGSDIYPTLCDDAAIQTEVGQVVAEKSALGLLFSDVQ